MLLRRVYLFLIVVRSYWSPGELRRCTHEFSNNTLHFLQHDLFLNDKCTRWRSLFLIARWLLGYVTRVFNTLDLDLGPMSATDWKRMLTVMWPFVGGSVILPFRWTFIHHNSYGFFQKKYDQTNVRIRLFMTNKRFRIDWDLIKQNWIKIEKHPAKLTPNF